MRSPGSLEQVVLVPRNGLGNRLQAWASAAVLAAQLDVPLKVMWEPEAPAPAEPEDLFSDSALRRSFMGRPQLDALLGIPHEQVPRYLTFDSERAVITLAGHDRGEQVFMPELISALTHLNRPHTLVIIAGGLFHLPSSEDFLRQRMAFYRALPWQPNLRDTARALAAPHGSYCALHIRQTDRSLEAPTPVTIREGLATLADRVPERQLFIAADSAAGRELWADTARAMGFEPWHAEGTVFDRTEVSGAISAAIDWMLLSGATALAYPAASTFSAEAAVASGTTSISIPMTASASRQRARSWGGHLRNALTYPARHWRD